MVSIAAVSAGIHQWRDRAHSFEKLGDQLRRHGPRATIDAAPRPLLTPVSADFFAGPPPSYGRWFQLATNNLARMWWPWSASASGGGRRQRSAFVGRRLTWAASGRWS
jgi:hypothetical protein